jgi:zinc transport system permease protein
MAPQLTTAIPATATTITTINTSTTVLDDFLVRATLAGFGLATIAGPLGCFIVWRRLSYFGDTLAHAALLGVALSLLLNVSVIFAVFAVALVAAFLLVLLQKRSSLASDAILGFLSHGALAVGLLALSFMTWVRFDMMGLLFGDLLAVTRIDLAVLYGGGAVVLLLLWWFWKPLFAATVNRDIAAAEGMQPEKAELLFIILLAAVVAIAIKIVGVLLVTAMLIIPAAASRRLSSTPQQMVLLAILVGIASVAIGLWGSLAWNTPSGPSIIAAAALLFLVGLVLPRSFSVLRS